MFQEKHCLRTLFACILFESQSEPAMAKVQALLNAVNRCTKNADIVADITNLTFLNPTCTRWSSDFAVVKRVVDIGVEKERLCQQELGQEVLTDAHMTFLIAYLCARKPLAIAMELFQGEGDCYIGQVIPTVLGVKSKLSLSTDPQVVPLVGALIKGLDTRFRDVMISDKYIISAILIPRFKINFVQDEAMKEQYRKLLINAVREVYEETTRNQRTMSLLRRAPVRHPTIKCHK